jgi:anti-sigma regulatory factor (Ser/Thr protein kinase)
MTQSAILNRAEFTLDGNLHELGRLSEEIGAFCRAGALESNIEFDLNLAMEELFTNALRHGGCSGIAGAVRIRLQRTGNAVEAEFSDRGPEFDPLAVPLPDIAAPLGERPIGGLGLHLVRRTMSGLTYERSAGWNRITMRRLL